MQDDLPRGGLIRKLWAADAEPYRDHLLRLDAESRHSRFGGGVSEQFLRDYADLAFGIDAICYGFFIDGTRGVAELRPVGARSAARGRSRVSIEKVAKSRRRSTLLARTLLAARNRASNSFTWPALPITSACAARAKWRRAHFRLRQRREAATPRPTPLRTPPQCWMCRRGCCVTGQASATDQGSDNASGSGSAWLLMPDP